jgi:hypothetical protein
MERPGGGKKSFFLPAPGLTGYGPILTLQTNFAAKSGLILRIIAVIGSGGRRREEVLDR